MRSHLRDILKSLDSISSSYRDLDERIDVTDLLIKQMEGLLDGVDSQPEKGEIELTDLTLIYMISLFTNIKHVSWSYENEFRCTVGKNDSISPYISAYPKEIYIGLKCNSTYRDKLENISSELSILVYQMVYDEITSDFNLIPKII